MIPKEESRPLEVFRDKLRYDIIPLIEEYCYANRALMKEIIGNLVGQDGSVNADVLDGNDNGALIAALKWVAESDQTAEQQPAADSEA